MRTTCYTRSLVGLFFLLSHSLLAQIQPAAVVRPLAGILEGNVFPGSSRPFSLVRLGPDYTPPYGTNGYGSSGTLLGFSHTHTSGTGGGPRYGNVRITPLTGSTDPSLPHYVKNERATPGYYAVDLGRKSGDCQVELTSTRRAALHRYRFYTWDKAERFPAWLELDAASVLGRKPSPDGSRCLEAQATTNPDGSVQGYGRFAGGWGGQNPYTVYFYAKPSLAAEALEPFSDSLPYQTGKPEKILHKGIRWKYTLRQRQEVELRVGISFRSLEKAKENYQQEVEGRSFEEIRRGSESAWNQALGQVRLQGGDAETQALFYTHLYHTLLMPTDMSGEDPAVTGNQPIFWEHYCLWDVFRSVMPLHTLLYPQHQSRVVQSMLGIYQRKGWLPDAWVAGDYAQMQGGSNADVVLADAMVKGLKGFDYALAYEAAKKNATVPSPEPGRYGRELGDYLKYGYLGSGVKCGSSRTLEYWYNDFCLGQMAEVLGKGKEAEAHKARSRQWTKLFQSDSKFFWAKDYKGTWAPDFSPTFHRPDSWNGPYFYEGSPWDYATYVPQDFPGLVKAHGGPQAFRAFLTRQFEGGHYHLSNEPTFLTPYLFNYAWEEGRSFRENHRQTVQVVHGLLRREYNSGQRGLPGQDDSGALSSWHVWGVLGLFPLAGQDLYLLGAPLVDGAEIPLEGGQTLQIKNTGFVPGAEVVAIRWKGQDLKQPFIRHTDLVQGGVLEYIWEH